MKSEGADYCNLSTTRERKTVYDQTAESKKNQKCEIVCEKNY